MEERIRFIGDALSDRFTMSELCARYGVSGRVGYKWLARYEEGGRRGLCDLSRPPHHCPHRIDGELADMICAFRRQHPFWGARKLLRVLGPASDPVGTISSAIRTQEQGAFLIDFDLGTVMTSNTGGVADLYLDANVNFNVGAFVPAGQQPRR